jgi:hypothetical protein
MMTSHNDGRFPDDSPIETRFPLNQEQHDGDREAWPWLPGTIVQQVGPDEWQVCVEDIAVATRKEGSRPTPRTRRNRLYYPPCFRDSSEPAGQGQRERNNTFLFAACSAP